MTSQESTLPVAVQLYSLRTLPGAFDETLAQVARVGYTAVETVGDHGCTAAEMRALLDKHGLQVIADEPTSMLDASLRVTVLNLLLDLRQRHNMSILFITHDLGQAYYTSDRILVMYRGELVEQGPVERCWRIPSTITPNACWPMYPGCTAGAPCRIQMLNQTLKVLKTFRVFSHGHS